MIAAWKSVYTFALREHNEFAQRGIERRAGMVRPYISRVENGHTIPSLETIERFASALDIPTYQLFISLDEEPDGAPRAPRETDKGNSFGKEPKERRQLMQLWRLLGKMSRTDLSFLESLAIVLSKR